MGLYLGTSKFNIVNHTPSIVKNVTESLERAETALNTYAPTIITITTSVDGITSKYYIESGSKLTIQKPSKDGYKFNGWYLNDTLIDLTTYTFTANTTLYAQFKEVLPHTSYDAFTFSYDTSTSGYMLTSFDSSWTETDITVPDTYNDGINGEAPITIIKEEAFKNNTTILSVDLSHCTGLIELRTKVFQGCRNLVNVYLPESLRSTYTLIFDMCNKLQYNTYDNVKYLGNKNNPYILLVKPISTSISSCHVHPDTIIMVDDAFRGCNNITSMDISHCTNIKTIEFSNCDNLSNIILPTNLECISRSAFYSCDNLTSIDLSNCTNLTEICHAAFENCKKLSTVILPNSLIKIGNQAFASTILTSITLPATLTFIGNYTFMSCKNLTEITIKASTPPTLDGISAIPSSYIKTIYIPKGTLSAYKKANNWRSYSTKFVEVELDLE